MPSNDRQRWARVSPGMAWRQPGLPTEWARVLERNLAKGKFLRAANQRRKIGVSAFLPETFEVSNARCASGRLVSHDSARL